MVDSVLCGHYCYNTDIFLLWYPGCNIFFVNNCFFLNRDRVCYQDSTSAMVCWYMECSD